jgi:UTP--glucose-1-phosphate uridylyltransferase
MRLRPSVEGIPFDAARFAALRELLARGRRPSGSEPLAASPGELDPLGFHDVLGTRDAERTELRRRGDALLRAGKVASVVLNGGMAMRFGGVAKGTVPVLEDRPESFLALKLADLAALARRLDAPIPAVVMHSFATQDASAQHLDAIAWGGVPAEARHAFTQSIMPRLTPEGLALQDLPQAHAWQDTDVYAAPGHGDTLRRLRDSGVLARLRARGVEHVLVSNVDNVVATLDPELVGAHARAVDEGHAMSVETVERVPADVGGVVATVEGRPVIVEGFRLPDPSSAARHRHFNTNTLWFHLPAIDRPFDLTWFPVHRSLALEGLGSTPFVQFEQLIGQATEHLPTKVLLVPREERFLPIKTRDDLRGAEPVLRRRVTDWLG